jgi:hypothetical protein
MEQAADVLSISARSAYRRWEFAGAWLYRHIRDESARARRMTSVGEETHEVLGSELADPSH